MGWFSRNDSGSSRKQTDKPRASVSSETQAAELRARARRRLAGAVALVVAAIIVLPMVLDSEPVPVADDIAINVPQRNTPYEPPLSAPQVPAPADTAPVPQDGESAVPPEQVPTPPGLDAAPGGAATPPDAPTAQAPVSPDQQKPAPKPEPSTAKPATDRSDDGSQALALLEGRGNAAKPAPSKPAAGGAYVLQIAAYTAQADANGRRDKLHQAGVTNAFVEPVTASGKQQYRLRVGPFPSREAAQAAQARLRTLGYDNGFIAAQ